MTIQPTEITCHEMPDGRYNSINPHRFAAHVTLVEGDHWLAHVLDRLIYRCQNSTLRWQGNQVFTEPLTKLATFVGATSIKTLQTSLTKLAHLGLIHRQAAYTGYGQGKQCLIWLDASITRTWPIAANDLAPVFHQAENVSRYAALSKQLADLPGKSAFLRLFILDSVLYRAQRDARRDNRPVESFTVAINLDRFADQLQLTERTVRRHLQALTEAGHLEKSKHKVGAWQVETRYRVTKEVWATLKRAACADACLNGAGKSRSVASLAHEENGQSRHEVFGQSHINININENINKNHITACEQPNVLRETCQDNEHKSDVTLKNNEKLSPATVTFPKSSGKEERLPLETNLLQTPTLNARQRRYVQGMLIRLTAEHGCQFSNPAGLLHEIYFALQQVRFIFPGRHSFRHRLNLIGKLLREKRWTTPHGYERYDPQGMAQKTQREEKEAAWQAEKAAEGQGGLVRLRSVTAANAPSGPPSAIATRLAEMRHLARRAEAVDCSTAARESIMALLQRHQAAIVAEMATQKESRG